MIRKLNENNITRQFTEKINPYEFQEVQMQSNYFSTERIAIYTCIFGNYDKINEPLVMPNNCDYFVITDEEKSIETNWKFKNVDLVEYGLQKESNIAKNRFFKMHPHLLFPEYKYSIYVDGNIKIMTDLTEFIQNVNSTGIQMHNHYRQDCIYKEIRKCHKMKKDSKENLDKHLNHLINNNMPKNYGMLEAPIIVRKHNNSLCIKIMEDWWQEFVQYSKRDQISLPYVLYKNDIKVADIATLGNDIYSNFAFSKVKHNL